MRDAIGDHPLLAFVLAWIVVFVSTGVAGYVTSPGGSPQPPWAASDGNTSTHGTPESEVSERRPGGQTADQSGRNRDVGRVVPRPSELLDQRGSHDGGSRDMRSDSGNGDTGRTEGSEGSSADNDGNGDAGKAHSSESPGESSETGGSSPSTTEPSASTSSPGTASPEPSQPGDSTGPTGSPESTESGDGTGEPDATSSKPATPPSSTSPATKEGAESSSSPAPTG